MTFKAPKLAVIPAAGKGTRFLPSTKATPKEMHPLLNLPLIHHCLIELQQAGVEEVILVSHPEKRSLENYFVDHKELKKLLLKENKKALAQELTNIESLPQVRFAYQDEQLGLAHAVSCAENLIAGRDFFLLLPDEIFIPNTLEENPSLDLKRTFESRGLSAITLLEVDKSLVSSYGVASIKKEGATLNVIDIIEKPSIEQAPSNLILPGRYLLKSSILEIIKRTPKRNGEIQLTDSLVTLAKEEGLVGLISTCPRFDGGSVLGFLKANIFAAFKQPDLKKDLQTFLTNSSGW